VNFIVAGDFNLPLTAISSSQTYYQAVWLAKEIQAVGGRAILVHYTDVGME